jgi:predicted nucleic acid-binding protein
VKDLKAATIQVLPIEPLIDEIWSRRDNLAASDAAYVALARILDYPLLTADARLAQAPNLELTIIPV